jgi:hypothetical protein
MRRGRAFDVVMMLAVAAFVALQIVGPPAPAPAALPGDTFTHVDMVVDEGGLHVTPNEVPAGQVEVSLVDNRADTRAPLTVKGVQAPFVFDVGTQLRTLRNVRRYDLVAYAGNSQHGSSSFVQITVPRLPAPVRPDAAHVVTLDVRDDGIMTPYREARLEQPVKPFVTADPPPDSRRWTTVAPGDTKVVVRNRTSRPLVCSVSGGDHAAKVGGHRRSSLRTILTADGAPNMPGFFVVTCTAEGVSRKFDFWTAS